jgi:hypothetical protein
MGSLRDSKRRAFRFGVFAGETSKPKDCSSMRQPDRIRLVRAVRVIEERKLSLNLMSTILSAWRPVHPAYVSKETAVALYVTQRLTGLFRQCFR